MLYDDMTGTVSLLIKTIGPGDEGEYTCTGNNTLWLSCIVLFVIQLIVKLFAQSSLFSAEILIQIFLLVYKLLRLRDCVKIINLL